MLEQEKLSSSATVTVEVGDINDNNPLFQRESFTAEIQETAIPGIKKEKLNGSTLALLQSLQEQFVRVSLHDSAIYRYTGIATVL